MEVPDAIIMCVCVCVCVCVCESVCVCVCVFKHRQTTVENGKLFFMEEYQLINTEDI